MCIACNVPAGRTFGMMPTTRRSFLAQSVSLGAVYATARAFGASPAVAQDSSADLLIENAKIITLDPQRPSANAIAIRGDRILDVGDRRDLEPSRGANTKILDAEGRTIIPGLNDSHTHFIRGGLTYSQELRWDGVPSLAIALGMLKAQALRTPAPHWVQVVGGWTAVQFAEKRLPTLDEINAATGDVPAFVMHIYDRAFLNKPAMRVLGFTKDSPEPFGGRFERDPSGNPTGVIINVTSIGSLLGTFARIPKLSSDDQIASTRHFMRELNRLGVTSVIDAGGGGQNYPENYQATAKLAAEKALTLRIGYSLFAQRPGKELDDYRQWVTQVKPGEGDDFFRMMGAGEYMIWATHDPANFIKDVIPPTEVAESQLVEAIKLVVSHGWPFRLHANYDVTVQNLLRAIETAHAEVPVDKVRWLIDHAETISPQSLERVAKLGGSIAIQNRMTLDGDAFAGKWGADAAADAPPIGRIREMGLHLAGGTDGNRASSHNPWVGLHWLITGRTIGGTKLNADRNLVDRMEALRLYSAAGAWYTGEENLKGTLTRGKWADLAILSDDYLAIPEDRIPFITSVLTVVGGRPVYGAGQFADLAPPAAPVAPDWLPIGSYPSYQKAEGQATSELAFDSGAAVPRIVGPHGTWEFGCLCGLL
jgi:predicted amidohydrolase YtcJ